MSLMFKADMMKKGMTLVSHSLSASNRQVALQQSLPRKNNTCFEQKTQKQRSINREIGYFYPLKTTKSQNN